MEGKSPAGVQVTIRYQAGGQELAVQADRFPYLIGRDSSSVHLALPDATVSRVHARLTCQDGAVWLENISATNKTALNGQYIQQPVQLRTGDKAIMGSSQLLFEVQLPAVPEGTQPPTVKSAPAVEPAGQSRRAPKNAAQSEPRHGKLLVPAIAAAALVIIIAIAAVLLGGR